MLPRESQRWSTNNIARKHLCGLHVDVDPANFKGAGSSSVAGRGNRLIRRVRRVSAKLRAGLTTTTQARTVYSCSSLQQLRSSNTPSIRRVTETPEHTTGWRLSRHAAAVALPDLGSSAGRGPPASGRAQTAPTSRHCGKQRPRAASCTPLPSQPTAAFALPTTHLVSMRAHLAALIIIY